MRAALALQRALCWAQGAWVLSRLPHEPQGGLSQSLPPGGLSFPLYRKVKMLVFQGWSVVQNHEMPTSGAFVIYPLVPLPCQTTPCLCSLGLKQSHLGQPVSLLLWEGTGGGWPCTLYPPGAWANLAEPLSVPWVAGQTDPRGPWSQSQRASKQDHLVCTWDFLFI